MTVDIKTLIVHFIEDREGTQQAIDGYMETYAFTRKYAFTYDEFKKDFPKIKPHAVVLDYDLADGAFHEEVYRDVMEARENENRYIGLIAVTAQDPFIKIKKILKSAGFEHVFYNDGGEAFYLDLIAEFNRIQQKLIE